MPQSEGLPGLVARKRGMVLEECNLKIGGDTGKGFLKVLKGYTSGRDREEKEENYRGGNWRKKVCRAWTENDSAAVFGQGSA